MTQVEQSAHDGSPPSISYPPTDHALLAWSPVSIRPYLQLMRLDRPAGFIYFYLPHVFGCVIASCTVSLNPHQLGTICFKLFLGTIFLRGATCTWNDVIDVKYDRKVERTRYQPIARGAVSVFDASILTLVLSLGGFVILLFMPPLCAIYAGPAILGWIVYPLAKRVTFYPQVVLGFPMAWGVFVGAAAVGVDPLAVKVHFLPRSLSGIPGKAVSGVDSKAYIAFWLANVAWTLCYETIYSFQDVRDDGRAGVKSIALLLGNKAKLFLASTALAQVFLLAITGRMITANLRFYAITVATTSIILATKIFKVRLSDPQSCLWWFSTGGMITGAAILSGLVGEYVQRL